MVWLHFFYKMYTRLHNTLKKLFFLGWFYFIIYHRFLLPVIILLKIILRKSLQSKDLMFFALSPEDLSLDGEQSPRGNMSSRFRNPSVARNLFKTPSMVSNPSEQQIPLIARNLLGYYHTSVVARNFPTNPDPFGLPNLLEGRSLFRNSHLNENPDSNMPAMPRIRIAPRVHIWGETYITPPQSFYSQFNEDAQIPNKPSSNDIPREIFVPNNSNSNPPLQPLLTENDFSHRTNDYPYINRTEFCAI